MATARLIADIGGTNARFALTGPDGRPTGVRKLRVADYPGPVEAARAYLAGRPVREAVLAVATPVTSDRVAFTNSPWVFSIRDSQAALGLDRLEVINDFTAQALAVPWLTEGERRQIGSGAPVPGQAIGVIGPGTGLGVGGLVPVGDRWQPLPGEGGHVSFAAHDAVDVAILAELRKRFEHVSNERVLSGPGLVNLAMALAALEGETLPITDPGRGRRARQERGLPLLSGGAGAVLGAARGGGGRPRPDARRARRHLHRRRPRQAARRAVRRDALSRRLRRQGAARLLPRADPDLSGHAQRSRVCSVRRPWR